MAFHTVERRHPRHLRFFLFNYWLNSLSKEYPTLWDWIVAVKAERKSDDNMTRKGWALRLISYLNSYISPVTHPPVSTDYKNITGTTVKSFLKAHVLDELDCRFKFQETVEEQDEAENTPAMTPGEVTKLYEQARTTALKVIRQNATVKWENHSDYYVRTESAITDDWEKPSDH